MIPVVTINKPNSNQIISNNDTEVILDTKQLDFIKWKMELMEEIRKLKKNHPEVNTKKIDRLMRLEVCR